MAEVGRVWQYQSRYRTSFSKVPAGNLVLIEGIDQTITKTATIVTELWEEEIHIFLY